jgi:PAS domain S-box-containing protein
LAEAETRLKRITHLQQAAATIEGGGLPAGSVRLETVDEAPQVPSEAPAAAREEHGTPSPPQRPPVATVWERLDLFPFVTPNPRLVTALQSFAKGAGLAVSIAGALVLLGWALDLSMLTSISSDFVSMKPNAALGFVLAGGTLHVLSTGVADRRLRFAALAAAFVVALIGLLTLSEYLYGWNLSIDRLVFSEATGALGTSAPARMAPTSAFCFFLLGVSLLVLDVRRCYPVAQLLTLLAALVSLTALIGYVYGVGSLYMGGSSTAMALHSSLCFLLLSSGILLTRQDHGLLAIVTSDAPGGMMARRLLPAAILIPLLLGWLTVLGEEAGFHGPAFGVFLVVIWSIVSFAALTWWNSGSLYRLDIERQRAEEELKKGQAQLAEAQRIARVGSAEWDIANNSITWSDEMFRMFGYEAGEVEPGYEAFLQRVHPDDRKTVEQNVARTLHTGQPFAFDYRIVRPDGSVRMAHGEGKVVRDDAGEPARLLGTAQDITERKQIEHALRQNETRTRSIIDTANDAFVAIDAADVIKDWNPQAELTFGWTREEALGCTLAETIIPPTSRETHLDGLHRYVLAGEGPMLNRRVELEALHKDGHLFPVELTISPIRWGRSHIFSAFIRDITERKRAEEALARQTRELTRINSELEDFTHSVSHDLKEPLRGIEAFAGFIAEDYADKLDEQGQRYVNVLRESAVRMKDLIDDLLQLSRLGRTRLEQALVPMSTLVQDVSLELSFALQEKQVQLSIDPDMPTVPCDRARMREVFKNLISNAVKYNDKPQPRIEVGCRSDNGVFTFGVRDNGIGIAPEFHEKIFKIFQRLHHREEYEGTGVGLAICKKVIEGHGGRIWVESSPGNGTTFLFTIPRTGPAASGQEGHEDGNYARAV